MEEEYDSSSPPTRAEPCKIEVSVIVDDLSQTRGFALPNVTTSAPGLSLSASPATALESVASGD